jgi:hypothetical protein
MSEKRGRPGQFRSLRSVETAAIIPGGGRPQAPEGFTPQERALWAEYVGSQPDHYFGPELQPILAELVKHVLASQRVHEEVKAARDGESSDFKQLLKLLRIQAVETNFVIKLSDKLRLNKKSRWTQPQLAAKQDQAAQVRPWEGGH